MAFDCSELELLFDSCFRPFSKSKRLAKLKQFLHEYIVETLKIPKETIAHETQEQLLRELFRQRTVQRTHLTFKCAYQHGNGIILILSPPY